MMVLRAPSDTRLLSRRVSGAKGDVGLLARVKTCGKDGGRSVRTPTFSAST